MTDPISLQESITAAARGHWREVDCARKKRKYFSRNHSDDEGSWDFRSDGGDSWDSQATIDFESEKKMVKKRVTKVKQWLTTQDHEEEPVGPCRVSEAGPGLPCNYNRRQRFERLMGFSDNPRQ
jgi:hypothetical protein